MRRDTVKVLQMHNAERVAYTLTDAVTAIGLSRATIYRAIQSGHLPAHKVGRRTLLLVDDLKRWLAGTPTLREPAAKK